MEAHSLFMETYEIVCGGCSWKRTSYAPVLGFEYRRWTLAHEKKFVLVLLELIAHGICPKDKLVGLDLTKLPVVPFQVIVLTQTNSW